MILTIFWRTLLFYFFLLIVMRIMGKREISGLAPIDLAVTIIMAELAAIPIQNTDFPVLAGIVPIGTIMLLEILLSALSMRSQRWRSLINGRPNVIIKDGKFLPKEMKKVRYTINDVMEQLRRKGHADVTDVEVAVIETDGNLSVIPKSQRRPLRPEDLEIPTRYEGLPQVLINDGEVEYAHLKACDLDIAWLTTELEKRGIQDVKEVFCAILSTSGDLFVQRREDVHWYMQ